MTDLAKISQHLRAIAQELDPQPWSNDPLVAAARDVAERSGEDVDIVLAKLVDVVEPFLRQVVAA